MEKTTPFSRLNAALNAIDHNIRLEMVDSKNLPNLYATKAYLETYGREQEIDSQYIVRCQECGNIVLDRDLPNEPARDIKCEEGDHYMFRAFEGDEPEGI